MTAPQSAPTGGRVVSPERWAELKREYAARVARAARRAAWREEEASDGVTETNG